MSTPTSRPTSAPRCSATTTRWTAEPSRSSPGSAVKSRHTMRVMPVRGAGVCPAPQPEHVHTRPALGPRVQLMGAMQGTGYQDQQWLIDRDGRFLQVTELLYRVAEQADGSRALEDIAARVTATTDWSVSADNVRQLIEQKLVPLGVIAAPGDPRSAEARTS